MTYCKQCGKLRIVDAPPFAEMTAQEIREWREAGGKVVLLECSNGCKE